MTPLPEFLWAAGIEDTFIPQARPGLRRLEEYELTGHDRHWKADLDRVAASGATGLRWGIPWWRTEPEPGVFDWSWTDEVLQYAAGAKGLTVILDLIHYGTPLWLENSFVNADYPERVAAYAAAATERYRSLVRHITPVNEPIVGADFSGRRAEWPPYLSGDDGFVKLAVAVAKGAALSAAAIRSVDRDVTLVQVEAMSLYRAGRRDLEAAARHKDEEQFLAFDLATGRVRNGHPLLPFLRTHGVDDCDLAWFERHAATFDVFGVNFYPWSNVVLERDRSGAIVGRNGGRSGLEIGTVLRRVHARYGLPMMITETSAPGPMADRTRWMDETVEAVIECRGEGLPVHGYTWFPIFPMIDWSYRIGRKPLREYTLHLGLYDGEFDAAGELGRDVTPLLDRFRIYASRTPQRLALPDEVGAETTSARV